MKIPRFPLSLLQRPKSTSRRRGRGFTLVELLVSITVLALILAMTARIIADARSTWSKTASRVTQFRDARLAFELITRNLGQATLNTYFDYDNPDFPQQYVRKSELHFITGDGGGSGSILSGGYAEQQRPTDCVFFQAYLGHTLTDDYRNLGNLLNGRGYYIQHTDGTSQIPNFISSSSGQTRYRFRLWEWMPPSEYVSGTEPGNQIYNNPTGNSWFNSDTQLRQANRSRLVAENVIALVISPRASLADPSNPASLNQAVSIAPNFFYDSRQVGNDQHLLPPLVQVTVVAIDEPSAVRLEAQNGSTPPDLVYTTSAGSTIFDDPLNYETDLEALEESLASKDINYRIFTTTIAMRGAKWDANSF